MDKFLVVAFDILNFADSTKERIPLLYKGVLDKLQPRFAIRKPASSAALKSSQSSRSLSVVFSSHMEATFSSQRVISEFTKVSCVIPASEDSALDRPRNRLSPSESDGTAQSVVMLPARATASSSGNVMLSALRSSPLFSSTETTALPEEYAPSATSARTTQ